MAEKGVAEESISRRLSRKRAAFYENDKTSDVKKKRESSPGHSEVEAGSCKGKDSICLGQAEVKSSASAESRTEKCDRSFFDVDCETLAQRLLGCVLVRERPVDGKESETTRGRIVETEAYLGGDDRAAHSYNNKKTERNSTMFMQPGTAYVYSIYGMHCCFNISSRGEGAAVLIRALEPLGGMEVMREKRSGAKKDKDLCSGPAKLCQAMNIDKSCNKLDLVTSDDLWVEPSPSLPLEDADIIKSARVGVDYAGEWAKKQLRFYIRGNVCISKK